MGYPSSGSIRVSIISMPSNSSSYPTSHPPKTGEQEEQEEEQQDDKEEENEGIGSLFVIKRNNTFMCLSTDQLKFLDMTNYIALGFSYDKYLKAYGCEVAKGHFPYEYMDRLERLDGTALPSKLAFFSRLKKEGISDEDYASCQEAWRDNAMTTLRDCLVRYNNRDVVPFYKPPTESLPSTNNVA